jgi:hypothetical protein
VPPATITTLSVIATLKPGFSARSEYSPTGKDGMVKSPDVLLVVLNEVLVFACVAVMAAPGTMAPLASVIVPVMTPRSPWLNNGITIAAASKIKRPAIRTCVCMDISPEECCIPHPDHITDGVYRDDAQKAIAISLSATEIQQPGHLRRRVLSSSVLDLVEKGLL